jgi:hypothetical protein
MRNHLKLLTIALISLVFASVSRSESLSELKTRAEDWKNEAKSIYRFDEEELKIIGNAYCDLYDLSLDNKTSAAQIGYQLQQDETRRLSDVLDHLKTVRDYAEKVRQNPDEADGAKEVLDDLQKEETRLKALNDGVILRGSNHPFVQFAIDYGNTKHKEMCVSFAGSVKVCDVAFPTLDGRRRPDLVTVKSDGLWVYEFKPNNPDAKSLGERQLSDYQPGVAKYYQGFFPNGRTGETKGENDAKLGGLEMLKAIANEPKAWESDDKTIRVQTRLETYERCQDPKPQTP